MTRFALSIEYLGHKFHGSQYQLGVRTVQDDLEKAIEVLARQKIRVTFSGRTDAGVHARGQVAHFDWPGAGRLQNGSRVDGADNMTGPGVDDDTTREAPPVPDAAKLAWSLNGILSADMSITSAQVVDEDFHARFSATARQYVYRILNRNQRSCLLKDTHYFQPRPLDLESMQAGASRLVGRHDFKAFRSSNADTTSTRCDVTRAEILNLGEGQLEFWITADHFVYNMVRIIVGTMVEIGLGKSDAATVDEALARGIRDLAGPTAPAWGLTLNQVTYPDRYRLFQE